MCKHAGQPSALESQTADVSPPIETPDALTRRAGSGADATAIAAEARRIYDDLTRVLGPLISQLGVDALLARTLHLSRREYPSDLPQEEQLAEPFGQFSLWLERQESATATDAAAATFPTFAALLATLIGEPLTTPPGKTLSVCGKLPSELRRNSFGPENRARLPSTRRSKRSWPRFATPTATSSWPTFARRAWPSR